MPDPVPTTEGSTPQIKIPKWAWIIIGVGGIAIAYFYKQNQEKKESFFSPTPASENRLAEPGFGGSAGAGASPIPTGLLEPGSKESLPSFQFSDFLPVLPPSSPVVPPQPVFPSPTVQETNIEGLTPNQINAREKGYPVVLNPGGSPQPGPYPQAEATVGAYFPTEAEHFNYVKTESHYVEPPIPSYPAVPTPQQYPNAFNAVNQAFPGGEAEHIKYVKEHSHYV